MVASAAARVEMTEPTQYEVFVALLRHVLKAEHPLSSQHKMNRLSNKLAGDLDDVLSAAALSGVQRACSLALAGDEVRDAMNVLDTQVVLHRIVTNTKSGYRFHPDILATLPSISRERLEAIVARLEEVYDLENKIFKIATPHSVDPGLGCADTLLSREMPQSARKLLDKRLEAFVCVLAINLATMRKTPLSPESADACLKLIEDAQVGQMQLLVSVLSWNDESKNGAFDLQRALEDHSEWRKSVQHFLAHETIERMNPYKDGDKQ